jgi:hypothetical protein
MDGEDFRFWQPGNYVSGREILRPEAGGVRALLVTGGPDSLAQGPLAEASCGAGRAVFCQAFVSEKWDTEPAAARLVQNILDSLSRGEGTAGGTVLVNGERDGFQALLESYGLDFTAAVEGRIPADARLVILHGGGPAVISAAQGLGSFLSVPGERRALYWHEPDGETFNRLSGTIGLESFGIEEATGPLAFNPPGSGPYSGVLREDLAYAGPGSDRSWLKEFVPDGSIIDRCVMPARGKGETARYEVEGWQLSGRFVRVSADKTRVEFMTNGSAAGVIETKKEGLYRIGILASGTPAENQWPAILLKVDGLPAGRVGLSGKEEKEYSCMIELAAGRHNVELLFSNDAYVNGEDRNLFVDALLVPKEPAETGRVKFLSSPPAIVSLELPNGNRVFIDCVRWDANQGNRVKANRYANALLAGLGASFKAPARNPDWLGPADFKPEGTIPHYGADAREVSLVANGTVVAPFLCARAGRYELWLEARSSPVKGVYARVRIVLDDRVAGDYEIDSLQQKKFRVAEVDLGEGEHALKVSFINDEVAGGEDRNLYLQGAGFLSTEDK